jgi:hypothetical protein
VPETNNAREHKRPAQRRFRKKREPDANGTGIRPLSQRVIARIDDATGGWEMGEGQDWSDVGFLLSRHLKAEPELQDASPEEAIEIIENALWEEEGQTLEGRLSDYIDDPVTRLQVVWSQVRVPAGTNEVHRALVRANALMEQHNVELPGPHSPAFTRFIACAYFLQRDRGEQTIYFAPALWCRLFGVSEMCLSNWKRLAVRLGFLDLVVPAVSKQKAAEFRFDVSAFPEWGTEEMEQIVSSGGDIQLDDEIEF